MSQAPLSLPQARGFAQTQRPDAWWLQPVATFLGLFSFIIYSTWAAFQGNHYWLEAGGASYLSPFYSPEIWGNSPHAWFGPKPDWLPWPSFMPFSPAFLVLWAPGGFRFTCYYYRGAYYKAFWGDPPSCAVGEPGFRGKNYRGEAKLPLILQNLHRMFLRVAQPLILILCWDAIESFRFKGADGAWHFGIGVGSIIMLINPILLGSYTFGCHSLRHLVGGCKDRISECSSARRAAYGCVSGLNKRHMLFAWLSLFWVGFTDAYVRLCSMGIWHDFRLF